MSGWLGGEGESVDVGGDELRGRERVSGRGVPGRSGPETEERERPAEEGGGGRGTRWWTANPSELWLLKHLVGRRWEHAGVEGFERTGG